MSNYFKHFGASPTEEDLMHYQKSPQWSGQGFENIEPFSLTTSIKEIPFLLYEFIFGTKKRAPKKPLFIKPFDADAIKNTSSKQPQFAWFGHSALYLHLNSKHILIDPMFGPDTAPVAPFSSKRYSENTLQIIETLPNIDAVLISHDHYDHLDYPSIQRLLPKVDHFYVALGVARHLRKWGISAKKISEFDWWDTHTFSDIDIHFTPTRHFSGRGLTDRNKSLWGGWVLKDPNNAIYFSGDSGYGSHFIEVGNKLGPFDLGFMECGQYDVRWKEVHMMPEESVQAAIEAKVRRATPVHWAGFTLALHHWTDPVIRFKKAADEKNLATIFAPLGSVFSINEPIKNPVWWNEYDEIHG